MNSMTINEFSEYTGWNVEKIRNFLRERVLPYEKIGGRTMIVESQISKQIRNCYGALTIKAWKRKLPMIPTKTLSSIFRDRQIPSCGTIRKQPYFHCKDILQSLQDPLNEHEKIIKEVLS